MGGGGGGGKGRGLKGEDEIRWADVASGCDGMTIVVRIIGGREPMIEQAFIIFHNQHRIYSIKGVSYDVPSV